MYSQILVCSKWWLWSAWCCLGGLWCSHRRLLYVESKRGKKRVTINILVRSRCQYFECHTAGLHKAMVLPVDKYT